MGLCAADSARAAACVLAVMAARPAIADSSAQQKAVLGALTKKDPHIVRVVDTAAHVALYEFDEVKQVWVRPAAPHCLPPERQPL